MVIARFSIQNKMHKIRFFEETFLLANISINIILEMSFLTFSNISIQFHTESFIWKSYSIAKTLLIARLVELIDKYKFAITALDKDFEIFIVYIAALKVLEPVVYPFRVPILAAL